jgi:hypothetical protein
MEPIPVVFGSFVCDPFSTSRRVGLKRLSTTTLAAQSTSKAVSDDPFVRADPKFPSCQLVTRDVVIVQPAFSLGRMMTGGAHDESTPKLLPCLEVWNVHNLLPHSILHNFMPSGKKTLGHGP